MYKLKTSILGITLLLVFATCREEIQPLEGPERLVVEGWVTDQPGPFKVKISTTENFSASGPTPRVGIGDSHIGRYFKLWIKTDWIYVDSH